MTIVSIHCDQCDVLAINGVACHETGCPNTWMDPTTGKPYSISCKSCKCKFIPTEIEPDNSFCSPCCASDYYGVSCNCDDCCDRDK